MALLTLAWACHLAARCAAGSAMRCAPVVPGARKPVAQDKRAAFVATAPAVHAQCLRQMLEQGDVEEALNAASQIGDDTLQRQSQGTVRPVSATV